LRQRASTIGQGLKTWPRALTMILGSAAFCACAAGEARADVGMTVQPLVIEFKASPGAESFANVSVNNSGSEPIRVTVQQIDWRTTVDGSVRMERVGAEGPQSLNPYLNVSAPGFELSPGETRRLTITARLPADYQTKSASTWGGFFVRGTRANGAPGAFGPAATVLAYNTMGTPSRHMQLTALQVTQTGPGTVRLFTRLRNDGENYIRPSARVMIEQGGRVIGDATLANSTVFPGDLRVIRHDFGGLAPGQYGLEITFDYGGNTLVEGTTDFRVN
jgi:hypothetical protein